MTTSTPTIADRAAAAAYVAQYHPRLTPGVPASYALANIVLSALQLAGPIGDAARAEIAAREPMPRPIPPGPARP